MRILIQIMNSGVYFSYSIKRTLKNGVLLLYFFACDMMCQREECTVYDLPKKESLLSQYLYRWLAATKGFSNAAYKLLEGSCENTSQLDSIAKDSY